MISLHYNHLFLLLLLSLMSLLFLFLLLTLLFIFHESTIFLPLTVVFFCVCATANDSCFDVDRFCLIR